MGFRRFLAMIISLSRIMLRQDLQRLFIFSLDMQSIFSDFVKQYILYANIFDIPFISLQERQPFALTSVFAYRKHEASSKQTIIHLLTSTICNYIKLVSLQSNQNNRPRFIRHFSLAKLTVDSFGWRLLAFR